MIKEKQAIHDYKSKLLQPSVIPMLREYISWQAKLRNSPNPEELYSEIPHFSPVSINLDLTTACNYACGHCVDMDILNTGVRYTTLELKSSLHLMHKRGLRSVILIGGGEPTLAPEFEDIFGYLKKRDISVAVVTNGSRMKKIGNVGEHFSPKDWVRLSLDSGTDQTFQEMHKPKKGITLEKICGDTREVKTEHPNIQIGFSYIVTWKGAHTNNQDIVPNIHEMVRGAQLARDHKFDYISFKPFLDRAEENNAEVIGIDRAREDYEEIMEQIRTNVIEAKKLETDDFKIVEGNNLGILGTETDIDYTKQPHNCHMTFFRQVLSPLGTFNCPVYRIKSPCEENPIGKVGENNAYASPKGLRLTNLTVARHIREFDATHECKDVTCSYNPANWFIEDLIEKARTNPEIVDQLEPTKENADFFL